MADPQRTGRQLSRYRHRIANLTAAMAWIEQECAGALAESADSSSRRSRAVLENIGQKAASMRSAAAGKLRIVFRPLLVQGMLASDDVGPLIFISADDTPEEQVVTLWHETVHLLLQAAGHTTHDEQVVESIAHRLAAACPEILGLVKREA
jgi:hypothetical protein